MRRRESSWCWCAARAQLFWGRREDPHPSVPPQPRRQLWTYLCLFIRELLYIYKTVAHTSDGHLPPPCPCPPCPGLAPAAREGATSCTPCQAPSFPLWCWWGAWHRCGDASACTQLLVQEHGVGTGWPFPGAGVPPPHRDLDTLPGTRCGGGAPPAAMALATARLCPLGSRGTGGVARLGPIPSPPRCHQFLPRVPTSAVCACRGGLCQPAPPS